MAAQLATRTFVLYFGVTLLFVRANISEAPRVSVTKNRIVRSRWQRQAERSRAPTPCDGSDVGLETCADYGHEGGILGCDATCSLDFELCFDCGDGVCELASGESSSVCPADCPIGSIGLGFNNSCVALADGTATCWVGTHLRPTE